MKLAVLMAVMLGFAAPMGARASIWPFWDHYAARFLTPQGRIIDPSRNSMTTSEGQSYALFFALVANDSSTFERIRAWTEENLARGDLAKNLPAWSWGHKDDGSWGVLDKNSASDADLWIAYTLLQAAELWSQPRYGTTGRAMLSLIAKHETAELPQVGEVLLPGGEGFHPDAERWLLNPSYTPLPLLLAAKRIDPGGPWNSMASVLPQWLEQASPHGFAMDWVEYKSGSGFAPAVAPGGASKQPCGSYDAIRVYLWAGITAPESPGAAGLLRLFAPMAAYVKSRFSPPETVNADGTFSAAAAPQGFSAAVVPFLLASGEKAAATLQLRDVMAQMEPSTGLLGDPPEYYDQNLALFALGWQQQRFRFASDGMLRVQWKK